MHAIIDAEMEQTLTQRLSASTGLSAEKTDTLLRGFVKTLIDSTLEGNAVAIPAFGTFQPQKIEEHISTDAKTGKRYLIPPEIKIEFKSSVVLRKKFIG